MLTVLVRLFCESSREGGGVVRSADPGKSLGPVAASAPGSSLGPVASADPGKSLGPSRRCRSGLYREVGRSAGWGCLRRDQERVRKGPAAPAGFTSLTCNAAPCPRAGRVLRQSRRQRVRQAPAAPAGRASITRGIAPCHYAGVGRPLCGQQCATGCGQHPQAGVRRGRRLLCWGGRRLECDWSPGSPGHTGVLAGLFGEELVVARQADGREPTAGTRRESGRALRAISRCSTCRHGHSRPAAAAAAAWATPRLAPRATSRGSSRSHGHTRRAVAAVLPPKHAPGGTGRDRSVSGRS